jgi:hypothetical protein
LFGIKDEEIDALRQRADKIFHDFLGKKTELPSLIPIENNHIFTKKDNKLNAIPEFKQFEVGKDYFKVKVNELFLTNQRKLWVKTDPTVLVNTELTYGNKKDVSVPFVVGPGMLKIAGNKIPTGGKMIIKDKTVAGFYPYKGEFRASVVLCQLNSDDLAKKIMKLVEAVAGALDYSTQLSAYLKVAGVVIDGIEEITGIKDGLTPLLGYDAPFKETGVFTIINSAEGEDKTDWDPKKLWIINNQLMIGKAPANAEPFRQSDYVLYSVLGDTLRDDIESLPFYEDYEKIFDEASKGDDTSWKRATTDLSTLYIKMYKSADLTHNQTDIQYDLWQKEIQKIHDKMQPKAPTIQTSIEDKLAMEKSFKALTLR